MRFVVCLLLIGVIAHGALATPMSWTICEGAEDLWQPVDVHITPDPAVAGEDISFEIKGQADHQVDAGYLVASVTFQGMPIAEEIKNLCSRTTCPIKAGPVDVIYKQNLPPFVPPGSYEVQVQLKDKENVVLMCIVVDFDINAPELGKVVSKMMGGFGKHT